jgi:branched-chain amino acid transport system ATP-binding protein
VTAALAVENLTVRYGGVTAVRQVSFDVPAGGTVCLIGANGAGKTSIMRGICGLVPQRSGSVKLFGQESIARHAAAIARAGLAHVPEGREVFARLSVEENLRMGGLWLTRAAYAARRAQVFALFPRLHERRGQCAGLLSGGEQQMVAIGRAIMADPKLILFDEPSLGLAPKIVDEIFAVIGVLQREGRTILLVEQNAARALAISDYAYVLETGAIALQGPSAQLAADPRIASAYLGGHISEAA